MKKFFYLILLLTVTLPVSAQLDPEVVKLLTDKNYFELETRLKSAKYDKKSQAYAQAFVYNAFGEYENSAAIVGSWKGANPAANDTLYRDLLTINIDNYYKLSRFKEADETSRRVMTDFAAVLNEEEIEDFRNTTQIWAGLAGTAPQEVILTKTTEIPFTRDIAKLVNIAVKHPGGVTNAVFDTGANISVASESTAKSMNLEIVADSIAVRAITGNEVQAKIGVARELSIGDISIKNAYFLVFDDADLTFGGGAYKINAIIGFPVIMGMGEIVVDQTANTMTVVKDPKPHPSKNLFVDGLTPIIQVKMDKTPLLLSFDSGADQTMFYNRFYELVKDGKKVELTPGKSTIGGAGGSKTIDIMVAKHLELQVGGEKVKLEKSDVLPDNLMDKKENLHGNLGQDVLKSRRKYVINLKNMYFELHD